MLVFMGLAVVAAFAVAWLWVGTSPEAPLGDLVNPTVPLALGVMTLVLIATCRIVGHPDGRIEVVGPLVTRRIPTGDVAGVSVTAGLRLVLRSGRLIGSFAHGQSLMEEWLGCPHAVAAAARVSEFVRSFPTTPPDRERDATGVTSHLRGVALLGAASLGVLLIAVTIVINRM
jgi:hypothetical protein